MGTVRRVCRDVKYWRSPSIAHAVAEAPRDILCFYRSADHAQCMTQSRDEHGVVSRQLWRRLGDAAGVRHQPYDRKSSVTNRSGAKAYIFRSLRIKANSPSGRFARIAAVSGTAAI